MFTTLRNKVTGTKSQKQIDKEKKLTSLSLLCDKLISLYPDFADSINNRIKKKINIIPFKTKHIDALIEEFVAFKDSLSLQVKSIQEESEKKESRRIAQEFANREAVKHLELQAKISELQTKLRTQCALPRELLESKIACQLHNGSYEKDFKPEAAKDSFLRLHSTHQYEATSYAIVHLKKDLEKFCLEYLTYIREYVFTLNAIKNISSLDEEERIQKQITAFKKLTAEKLDEFKASTFQIDTYQALRQSLKQSERHLSESLFSSIDSEQVDLDYPMLGEDGNYYSKVHLDINKALVENQSKEIKQIEDERFKIKKVLQSAISPCKEFKRIYFSFQNERIELLLRIQAFATITDRKHAEEEARQLAQLIELHGARAFHEIDVKLSAHKEVKQKQQEIKIERKLDSKNPKHLLHWDNLTEVGFTESGGVKIICEDATRAFYYVPTRIHRMMMILNEDHLDVDKLLAELNQARLHRPGLFSNPFSFLNRHPEVQAEYSRPFVKEAKR